MRFLLLLSLLAGFTARAEPISWFSDPGAINRTSSGQPMDGGFQFQLGAFSGGFVPTASNLAQWSAHWVAADTAGYLATKLYDGQFVLEDNAAPFTVNAKAWVWGIRTGGAGSEWILFRNSNWRWPAANPINPPLLYWNAKDANEVVLGAVHGSGDPFLLQSAAVSSYAQWSSVELAGESLIGPGEDADHDGVENLLEFVFGTPPLGGGALPAVPATLLESGGQSYVQITVPRRLDRLANLSVEVSGNLVQWNSGTAYTAVVSDEAAALVVRDLVPLGPANPARFIRVLVKDGPAGSMAFEPPDHFRDSSSGAP